MITRIRVMPLCIFILFATHLYCKPTQRLNGVVENTVKSLMDGLQRCDTTLILSMYDTIFSHIDQKEFRDYTKEEIVINCQLFAKVIRRHGVPSLDSIKKSKDPINGLNIAMLRLMSAPDSVLGLRDCLLIIQFPPDKLLYKNKIWRFNVLKDALNPKKENMIKAPPQMK